MHKYECCTLIDGRYMKFVREFESVEYAYAILKSEGYTVFSLKELNSLFV